MHALLHSVPASLQQATATHISARGSWTLTGKPGSVSGGVTAPFSWVLVCTQGFVCALQESVSLVLCKFCNQILRRRTGLPSKIPWGFSVPLPDPQIGKSVVGPRNFLTVREFLWYNCSAVCAVSARQLCGGVIGDLLQEGLATHCVTQVCCTQSPWPCGRPLLTLTSTV